MMWNRLLNRAARELVTRARVAPARVGYRFLPPRLPREFDYEQIDPPELSRAPLPRNVGSRDELPRESKRWGFSFHDVPERMMAETFIATIPNCRVLTAADEWGDPHYAIVTEDDGVLRVRGTEFERNLHAKLLASAERAVHVAEAAWIPEAWDRNYSHWVMWHLTKMLLLRERRPSLPMIVPGGSPLAPVIDRSMSMLGITNTMPLPSNVTRVDRLTVAGFDDFRPSLLRNVRDALRRPGTPKRNLFISRSKASRRRLRNEDELLPLLREHGFERVVMEDHSFDEQVALASDAAVLVSVHGTGLANMLFAPEGLHVVEISDRTFPNPQFYALASALGHHYWLLWGQPVGELRPGYHDVSVDVAAVASVLTRIA